MAKCSFCDAETSMPFKCKFCEQSFCSKHRLPENHDCQGLKNYKEKSRDEGKVGYDVIKNDSGTSPEITSRASQSLLQQISSFLPTPRRRVDLPLTYMILGVMLVVFMLQVSLGNWFSELFALFPNRAITQPWTIVTSMFLHGGLTHLLVNAIVLFSFGTEIEQMLGDRNYLALLFAAGTVSSLGTILSGVLFNMNMPAVGISGALFGLVAFLAVVRPGTRVLAFFFIPLKIRTAIGIFAMIDLANLVTQILHAAGLTQIPGIYSLLLGVQIGSAAHLSGLLVGLLFGYHMKDRYAQRRPQGIGRMYTQFNRF